jgi:hypothetical protein
VRVPGFNFRAPLKLRFADDSPTTLSFASNNAVSSSCATPYIDGENLVEVLLSLIDQQSVFARSGGTGSLFWSQKGDSA